MSDNQPKIMVSLDNGATYQEAPQGVHIVYNNVEFVADGKERTGTLMVTHHIEGRITDLYANDEVPTGIGMGTESIMLDVLIDALLEDNQ
jgi:hypothetical protein